MVKKNTCVFISGRGSNLKNLIRKSRDYNFPISIKLIISDNPNAYGINYAKKNSIPYLTINTKNKYFEEKIINYLKKYKITLVCLAGYMKIISKKLLSLGKKISQNESEKLKFLSQSFHGIEEVKIYDLKKFILENFKKTTNLLFKNNALVYFLKKLPKIYFELIFLIFCISILFFFKKVNYNFVEILPLITFYLAIEIISLTSYILATIKRNGQYSTEAGIKYFLLGAVSSGILLFGSSLLYALTGETTFQGLATFM